MPPPAGRPGSPSRMPIPVIAQRLARAALQVALAAVSSFGAWWLAAGQFPDEHAVGQWVWLLAFLLPLRALAYWPFGLYGGLWRYASVRELAAIVGAVATGSMAIALLGRGIDPFAAAPAGFVVADGLLLVFLLGGVRVVRRIPADRHGHAARRRVLVFGAGDAGAMILRDMLYRRESPYGPVGVIDDDPAKRGLRLHGVTVLGGRESIDDAMRRLAPDEVLIAIPSANLATLRAIVTALQPYEVPIKTLPSIHELPECHVELAHIRPLALEDLLTRPVVGLDHTAVHELMRGRRVLVTGAGGSIGSELCRQVLRWEPETLVLLERHENALFWLTNELQPRVPRATRIVRVLADVTNERQIDQVLSDTRPHIVFHAAAHKHVPMLEDQVAEAVRNNVFGTLALAQAAERHHVERFVLISTDKAVAPVSVMGATKRLCEVIVQALMRNSPMRCCAVRFGNVLGSNGSVTQVFLRQIRAGGPVTVTDPEMRRYFMLISEAVELVTQAATLAEPGTVYLLDMGDPIRIVDLARQLIRLAGYRPDIDIPIEFTGVRAGERLEETLYAADELAVTCQTLGLLRVVSRELPEAADVRRELTRLRRAIDTRTAHLDLELLIDALSFGRAEPATRAQAG